MKQQRSIEDILREDAQRSRAAAAPDALEKRELLRWLRPAIARACLETERRRKNRRQAALMLAAAVPVLLIVLLAAYSYAFGNPEPLKRLVWPAGIFSLGALLTLPILETFLPKHQPEENGGMIHEK